MPNTTEGGVFSGHSVLATNLSHLLVQAIIVIGLSRILHMVLRFLHQPQVIAEVISGICLGPSVFGRIPGFTNTIFPKSSIPSLQLVANFGLVMYMFLVGLEMDPKSFFLNIRKTAMISAAGMIVPFGLGSAISYGMYHQLLQTPTVPFSSFLLFTGVAMSITAFPILARILTEKRLFHTTVGSMTISSAAFDDATAWILLALVLSIINASDSLTALWVLLTMTAYAIILLAVVRYLLAVFVRKTMRSRRFATATLSQSFMAFVFIFIFASAWITEFIGINAIFGAFLVGVIMPRGTGIVVSLTEKMEDLVTVVLLPLYFASSGLKTHISVLSDGTTWLWLVAATVAACSGKIGGCTIAAKLSGLTWRESLSVGILMNTKALIELIVLNIGLDAGVINDRVFAVMVIMCLITTFMTSPLISFIYTKRYQTTIDEAIKQKAQQNRNVGDLRAQEERWLRDTFNVLACLDRMDQVPSMVGLANKLHIQPHNSNNHHHGNDVGQIDAPASTSAPPINLTVLRLMESTERSSTLFYASYGPDVTPGQSDIVLQIVSLFVRFLKINTKCFYAVAPVDAYNEEVERIAATEDCNILLLSIDADSNDQMVESVLKSKLHGLVPVVYVDRKRATEMKVIAHSSASPGLNETVGTGAPPPPPVPIANGPTKALVAFVGGRLDRKALKVAMRLSLDPNVNLTVLHVSLVDRTHTNGDTAVDGDIVTAKKYGAISYISSKLHSDKSPIDYDAEIMAEVKHEAEDRPHSITIRTATSTSLVECLIGECKEHAFDLVILANSTDTSLAPPRSKRSSSVNEYPATFELESGVQTGGGGGHVASPLRARNFSGGTRSSASIRDSFRRRARHHAWAWSSTKQNIVGYDGQRLLENTEASLLVVGQSDPDDDPKFD